MATSPVGFWQALRHAFKKTCSSRDSCDLTWVRFSKTSTFVSPGSQGQVSYLLQSSWSQNPPLRQSYCYLQLVEDSWPIVAGWDTSPERLFFKRFWWKMACKTLRQQSPPWTIEKWQADDNPQSFSMAVSCWDPSCFMNKLIIWYNLTSFMIYSYPLVMLVLKPEKSTKFVDVFPISYMDLSRDVQLVHAFPSKRTGSLFSSFCSRIFL